MPFQIVRNDITKMHVDAIVNTANPLPGYGPGIDTAVYEAAGKDVARKVKVFSKTPSVHDYEIHQQYGEIDRKADPGNEASGEVTEIIVVRNYSVLMNIENSGGGFFIT